MLDAFKKLVQPSISQANLEEELQEEIGKLREKLRKEQLDSGNNDYKINCLKEQLKTKVNLSNSLDDTIRKQGSKIDKLHRELTETRQALAELKLKFKPQTKIHNERGAGRNSRICDEHVAIVKELRSDGKGYIKIAKSLEKSTGEKWSASTVKYLIKTHLAEVR